MGRGTAKLAIKGAVTVLLLWLAFRTVDVGAVSTFLLGLRLVVGSRRAAPDGFPDRVGRNVAWRRHADLRASRQRGTAFLYCLVGWFFSNVAPSTVGGDIFRGVQLSRVGTPVGAAVRVIL